MDYLLLYKSIIRQAKSQQRVKLKSDNPNYVYYESHHIIPKCVLRHKPKKLVDGSWNRVLLTAREHFIAHRLLVKIFEKIYGNKHTYTRKMILAEFMFLYRNPKQRTEQKITSRVFSFIKERYANSLSEHQVGASNGNFRLTSNFQKVCGKTYYKSTKGKTWEEIYSPEEADKRRKNFKTYNLGKNFGKCQFHKSEEHRKRIGNSNRGKKRTEETKRNLSEKAKIQCKGSNNPMSKTYILTDPFGKEYHVTGQLAVFCLEHNLSPTSFYPMDGKVRLRNKNAGWKCEKT